MPKIAATLIAVRPSVVNCDCCHFDCVLKSRTLYPTIPSSRECLDTHSFDQSSIKTIFTTSLTNVPSLIFGLRHCIRKQVSKLHLSSDTHKIGPGVYEAALRFGDAVELADRGQLFKTSIKQLGLLQPILHPGRTAVYPSFMAKPSAKTPGCSGHIHLSLMDSNGGNLFYDATDPNGMSQAFKHFVAGLLYALPDVLPMYAPTVNSYKRLVENYCMLLGIGRLF